MVFELDAVSVWHRGISHDGRANAMPQSLLARW
jgi:hypothetical protein